MEKILQNIVLNANRITDDSRKVDKGSVFFATQGSQKDGATFIQQALERGASCIVAEHEVPSGFEGQWICVPDAKAARLEAAQLFYGNPFQKLLVHGVTGTSGKTTTAFLMEAMLLAANERVALLGTVHKRIGDLVVPSDLTTPGVLELHAFAAEAVKAGCGHLVMEVSSHALDQGRVEGVHFRSALFSNLSRDHLDYHQTLEQYFSAKKLLFTQFAPESMVVNVDDEHGLQLAAELSTAGHKVVRVSRLGKTAEFRPTDVSLAENGISLKMPSISEKAFSCFLTGDFNADNILLACAWASSIHLPESAIRSALLSIRVPGRFEMAFSDGARHVVVDYAHKPDALERVLQTARGLCKRKLVVVFGCGGDRDRGKRPLMGEIAERYADMCFVTSDNPRTENPQTILQEILAGMQKNTHAVIENRKTAIQAACRVLDGGDWLVVAGKGHEDYQIIGTTKYPFDDRMIVREAFGV